MFFYMSQTSIHFLNTQLYAVHNKHLAYIIIQAEKKIINQHDKRSI